MVYMLIRLRTLKEITHIMERNNYLNIACYNARGLMPSTRYITKMLKENNIDVPDVSEHWLFPEMLAYINTFCDGYCGYGVSSQTLDPYTSHRRGKGGIAIIFKETLKDRITIIDTNVDWIYGVGIQMEERNDVNVFGVYLPSSIYSNLTFCKCIEKLHNIYNQSSDQPCVILVYFNALKKR